MFYLTMSVIAAWLTYQLTYQLTNNKRIPRNKAKTLNIYIALRYFAAIYKRKKKQIYFPITTAKSYKTSQAKNHNTMNLQ